MDVNKITSVLSYIGSTILELKINNNIISLGNTETKEIGLDYGIQAIEKTEDELRAKIIMKISVFIPCVEETKNEYTMVIEGLFSVPVSVPEEEFIKLLSLNGAAALYSISRAKMESISAAVFNSGKIVLPMINMMDYLKMKEKEKQTAQATEINLPRLCLSLELSFIRRHNNPYCCRF